MLRIKILLTYLFTIIIITILSACGTIINSVNYPFDNNFENSLKHNQYTIYTDGTSSDLERFKNLIVAIENYTDKNLVKVNKEKSLEVYIVMKSKDYEKRHRGKYSSLYGYYMMKSSTDVLIINHEYGIGTLGHELMHYYVLNQNNSISNFTSESISTYMEKFIGYYDENESNITFGYIHPRRHINTMKIIDKVDLKDVITSYSDASSDKDVVQTFMLFMDRNDKFDEFIKLRLTSDDSDLQLIESLFNKDIIEIERDWKTWMKSIRNIDEITLVKAALFDKKETIDDWISSNNVYFDKTTKKFKTYN